MEKRKPEIIRDNKKRGEWAESVFVARAVEHGLEISKPFGESGRFDCVVGRAREVCSGAGEVHDCKAAQREGIYL